MKKILLAMLILALTIFAMASCNNKDDDSSDDTIVDDTCKHTNVVDVPEIPASTSCKEERAGRTAGKQCADCGAVIEGMQTIDPPSHMEVIFKGYKATCQAPGLTDLHECAVCNKVLKASDIISKLPHNVVAKVDKAPTCTEPGSTGGFCCSVCFTDLSDDENPTKIVDPTGNGNPCVPIDNPLKPYVAPTCSATGLTAEKICEICGAVLEKQQLIPIDPKAHELEITKEAKAATCTEKGYTVEETCKHCKNVITESTELEIDPDAHTYVDGVCTGCSAEEPVAPPADEE